jgi:Skp family chaperone for outer membrane proteins
MKGIYSGPFFVLSLLILPGQATAAQAPAIPADARVVYVSSARISNESAAGKAGAARVQAVQQARTADLRTRQQAIEATRKQLASAATPEERSKLTAQESTLRFEFERAAAQAQVELQNLQREISTELRPKLAAVLGELLKGTKVEAVLNLETAVLWGAPPLDVTAVVIERLNAAEAKAGPSAPAAAPATAPSPAATPAPATPTPRP